MKLPLQIAAILSVTAAPLCGLLTRSWEGFWAAMAGVFVYLCIRYAQTVMHNPGQGPGSP